MNGKDIVKTISEKEMDRKEFLKYSGLLFLSVFGLGFISRLISSSAKVFEDDHKGSGFGGGKYGV